MTETLDLMEDGLRWHRIAQHAVRVDDRVTARRAYVRRDEIVQAVTLTNPDLTRPEVLARLSFLSRDPQTSLCPCGITLVCRGAIAFSRSWHIAHRAVHLDTFPGVDARTIEILDDNILHAPNRG